MIDQMFCRPADSPMSSGSTIRWADIKIASYFLPSARTLHVNAVWRFRYRVINFFWSSYTRTNSEKTGRNYSLNFHTIEYGGRFSIILIDPNLLDLWWGFVLRTEVSEHQALIPMPAFVGSSFLPFGLDVPEYPQPSILRPSWISDLGTTCCVVRRRSHISSPRRLAISSCQFVSLQL